jgi:hypothetical protein
MMLSPQELKDYGYIFGKNEQLYELILDDSRKRLWLNASDGSAVARFNVTGVDIHNTVTDQLAGSSECLWCTHGKPNLNTWLSFIKAVKQHFGITILVNSINTDLLLK